MTPSIGFSWSKLTSVIFVIFQISMRSPTPQEILREKRRWDFNHQKKKRSCSAHKNRGLTCLNKHSLDSGKVWFWVTAPSTYLPYMYHPLVTRNKTSVWDRIEDPLVNLLLLINNQESITFQIRIPWLHFYFSINHI
jgi:hypothetical protein